MPVVLPNGQLMMEFACPFQGQAFVVRSFLTLDATARYKALWEIIEATRDGQDPIGTQYEVVGTWKHHFFDALGMARVDLIVKSYKKVPPPPDSEWETGLDPTHPQSSMTLAVE
ncbi:hypothetical protein BGZ94_000298 [Podila epigama]|nr:hypothetical protein BGZ94_000298 [Podila epigama]